MVASTNCMKLLAAGCVVGLLSGLPVYADGDAVANTGGDVDLTEYEPLDPVDEDPAADNYDDTYTPEDEEVPEEVPEEEVPEEEVPEEEVPEEEEPVEEFPPEEEPVEEVPEEEVPEEEVPEEEDTDAMAPGGAMPDGAVTPDADPEVLGMLGYDVVEAKDFTGATDLTMSPVENAEECAEECDTNIGCNMAAYFTVAPDGMNNCWLKAFAPGCQVPATLIDEPDAWLLISQTRCDVEVPTVNGTVNGTYTRYPGVDYIPSDVTGGPPNTVSVMDLGDGFLVDNIAGCEAQCDSTATCNAAAYLETPLPETGLNCYLKVLGDACDLPSDVTTVPDATLSLKCATAAAPAAAAPAAPGNTTDPTFSPPVDREPVDGETGTEPDDGVEPPDSSGVAGLYTSISAALAAAAAAALL